MKKSSLYCLIGGACLFTTTSLTLIASGIESTTQDTNSNQTLIAATTTLDAAPKSFSQNETVYVITDSTGHQTKSFVGNTINQSEEPIPVDMRINYHLDGNEISAEDLAHKSGHVKVTYDFTATKNYDDKKIPFLTVTGILLDSNKFNNVEITNGKLVNETPDNTILASYTLVGINEDLGLDLLPTTFSFEADVTDFALETTYTFATNEIFADLDTSKLSSIDELVGKLNQLSSSFDQIISGGNSLASGLDSALAGSRALQAGLNTLTSGANELATGATKLSDGLNQIVNINNTVLDKASTAINTVKDRFDTFIAEHHLNPDKIAELLAPLTEYYDDAKSKVLTYTGSIEALADGAAKLSDGANKLASGATELSLGSSTLTNGLEQLSAGSHTLAGGLITFKEQGINKLTDFANHDLANLTSNIRSTVNAAKSYHYYSNPDAKSVKFIFKTPSIK